MTSEKDANFNDMPTLRVENGTADTHDSKKEKAADSNEDKHQQSVFQAKLTKLAIHIGYAGKLTEELMK